MELKEIESILEKTRTGDFSVRIDESRVAPEARPLAQMINGTLEKAAEAKK